MATNHLPSPVIGSQNEWISCNVCGFRCWEVNGKCQHKFQGGYCTRCSRSVDDYLDEVQDRKVAAAEWGDQG